MEIRQRKKRKKKCRWGQKRGFDTNKNKVDELETMRKALNDLNKKGGTLDIIRKSITKVKNTKLENSNNHMSPSEDDT